MIDLWRAHVAWRLMPSNSYWRVAMEWEKRKAITRKSHRKARAKAAAAGLCPQCTKVRPNVGHVTCSVCRAKAAKAQRRHTKRQQKVS